MPETIYKIQPDRTMGLRGFAGLGAAAAITNASPTGFTVSGVFRDSADFAVVVIWDRDDFWGHPRLKYLPDANLAGLVLSFDLTYTGCQPIDSPKYATIDWPYLDVSLVNGTSVKVPLFSHATQAGGTYTKATGTFTISTPGAVAYDRVTLWFLNTAFDYIATGGETAAAVAAALASQINASYYGGSFSLSATVSGADITITASPAGYDGNMIRMYSIAKNTNLTATAEVEFSGGSSAATWAISLDLTTVLTALGGNDQVRQMWLTFAPALVDSAAYTATNWTAVFSSWAVADPHGIRALKVAGPGSVRIEETDSWVTLHGSGWSSTAVGGFYSQGFAAVTSQTGDSVTVEYYCQEPHDLWLGTALYVDRGVISCAVDGAAAVTQDCYLDDSLGVPILTRVKFASGLSAGKHTAVLTLTATPNTAAVGNYFYFDFLEAVVGSGVPDAPGTYATSAPAIDYDTQHGYQLPPARLMWMMEKLGFTGPIDEYVGVFWWNQRAVTGATFPSVQVVIMGTFNVGDQIFLDIGGQTVGKTVFPADTLATIGNHFVYFINETYSGVWAAATSTAGIITITARSPAAAYAYTFSVSTSNAGGTGPAAGTCTYTGGLTGGNLGTWIIDPSQTPALNAAAAAWHADLFALCAASGQAITAALSMELVNTPDDPATGQVWAARFLNGDAVVTATGFGGLNSTQCAPMASNFLAYQKACYLHLAQLQHAAGLTPDLQLGEFLWWYFAQANLVPVGYASYTAPISIGTTEAHGLATGNVVSISGVLGCTAANGTWTVTVTGSTHFTLNGSSGNGAYTSGGLVTGGGMAYYDAETAAAAVGTLGRSLASFWSPSSDPAINGSVDANFLVNRLANHVAAIITAVKTVYSGAKFEVLYPYDVNYPSVYGMYALGGRLNAYVNTPAAWKSPGGPLTRIKIEALDFGSGTRSLDLVSQAVSLAQGWGWPSASVRYLFPVFNGGCPYLYEQQLAEAVDVAAVTPFAMDHVCLFGWDLSVKLIPGAQEL
jgi:hypothetical protein